MNAIAIAQTGLFASAARLNASAANVANADTVGALDPANGPAPYQPAVVVQRSAPGGGVTIGYQPSKAQSQALAMYDPSSAFADAQGRVAAPAVDVIGEQVEQISALAAFKANLAVIRTADEMQRRLLDMKS